ncbi:SDR family NAD(P)-dependent oxidoreductase [Streptomyces sp. NPDC020845]|uniref:SDR family NAD(P)-dependent oxidoreductase n=1 Tax=Streptomyces sp. NPDC020845 TaxID=3365096 RepID=UPI003797C2FD
MTRNRRKHVSDAPDPKGRTALVTGGASGIGAAICRELAAAGTRVLIADVDEAGARRVADELPDATALAVDLDDQHEVAALGRDVIDRFGGVDILVNNAGVSTVEPFAESDPATWDRMWRINLRAPMLLSHIFLPGMGERGWGRLVFIATDGARAGAGGESVYATCKAGLFGLAKTLAREAARQGVTSNVVCPGLVDTPMLRRVGEERPGMMQALLRTVPVRRAGQPEEVAGLVTYLSSDSAAYVTGQTISVSGGVTMA